MVSALTHVLMCHKAGLAHLSCLQCNTYLCHSRTGDQHVTAGPYTPYAVLHDLGLEVSVTMCKAHTHSQMTICGIKPTHACRDDNHNRQ